MKKQLKDLKRGETFYGAGIQWTVLDHSRSSQGLPLRTFVVSTDITENRAFDEGNRCDFAASTLRAYLNGEFLRKLEDELGAGNICEYVIRPHSGRRPPQVREGQRQGRPANDGGLPQAP